MVDYRSGWAIGGCVAFKRALLFAAVAIHCLSARAAITPVGDVSPLPIMPNTSLQIGFQGIGSLLIDGGSALDSNFLQIAQGPNGVGTAIVRDPGTLWRFFGGEIGNAGVGRLEVLNGATVEVPSPSNLLRLANNPSANSTVMVDGPNSVLQVVAPFIVGQQGSALLRVSNGAIVNVPEDNTTVGVGARIELNNALVRTNQLQNGGTIIGSGELAVLSTGTLNNQGRLEAGPEDRLLISGATVGSIQNNGAIVAAGGEVEITRFVTNLATTPNFGRITLRDGTVRFPFPTSTQPGLQNSSLVAALGGENHVYGRILNLDSGDIVAANNSTVFFHHDVTSQGTISIAAGSMAIFLEDLVNGGILQADLAGAKGFGHAEVYGQADLGGGKLQLSLSSGYAPNVGDTFTLLSAAGGITGSLSLAETPNPSPLLRWDLDIDANKVTLSAVPALAGDYNANGTVDAADYIVWRQLLDQTGPGLPADGDDNGVVDATDYDFWRARFGNVLSAGATAATAAVPEPATLSILVGVVCLLGLSVDFRRVKHALGDNL